MRKRVIIDLDRLRGLWESGMNMTAISKELGCSVSVVRRNLLEQGVDESALGRSASCQHRYDDKADAKWSDIKADFDSGMTLTEMVAKYHMTRDRFRSMFKRHNYDYDEVQAKYQAMFDAAYKQQLTDYREAGWTIKEICTTVGKSESTVRADLMKFGLTHRADRTDIRDEDILVDWNSGISIHQIALKYSCSHNTVTKRLAKHGIAGSRKPVVTDVNCIDEAEDIFDKRGKKFLADLDALGIRNELFVCDVDVYLRDLNIGVNFNPTYSHSVDLVANILQGSHQTKSFLAQYTGVGLIHMYDGDFIDNRIYDCLMKQLSSRRESEQITRFGARECEVRIVSRTQSNALLDEYHFQGGEHNSFVQLGLFWHDDLIGVLTMGKARYTKDDYEIIRYCMNPKYRVSGCFGKLFQTFCRSLTESARIVTYMDLNKRFSASNVYEKNGFQYDGLTSPDYVWYNQSGTKMKSRYAVTKQQLVKQGFDASKSEIEIMHELGYYRVYGAGSKRYVYQHIVTR